MMQVKYKMANLTECGGIALWVGSVGEACCDIHAEDTT